MTGWKPLKAHQLCSSKLFVASVLLIVLLGGAILVIHERARLRTSEPLTDQGLSRLMRRARAGDGMAYNDVFTHYYFRRQDRLAAIAWAEEFANRGSPVHQYAAGTLLLEEGGVERVRQSVYWLRLAAHAGYPGASNRLQSALARLAISQ